MLRSLTLAALVLSACAAPQHPHDPNDQLLAAFQPWHVVEPSPGEKQYFAVDDLVCTGDGAGAKCDATSDGDPIHIDGADAARIDTALRARDPSLCDGTGCRAPHVTCSSAPIDINAGPERTTTCSFDSDE